MQDSKTHNWREMMNRLTILFTLPLAFFLIAISANAALLSGPSLNASLLYYEPVPAYPGSSVDVFVQVTNNGETARRVRVEFVDNGPFTLDSSVDGVRTLETLPGQQSFLIKYRVRVSQSADPGTNYIKVRYSPEGTDNVQTSLLPIQIFSSTVGLNLQDIKLEPETFVPGGVGRISFTIENLAPLSIKDGTVTLDLSELAIAPVGSTNQQRFTNMQSGEERQFTFRLSPSPDMAPGIYKVPAYINFSDQQGNSFARSEYIGIRIGAKPDVSITLDDTKLTTKTKTGDVIIRVTNKGIGEIKFVNLVLGNSESYDLLSGSQERYVGNIDSDDYKTARVTLEATADNVEIPVTVTYMDALNTPYSQQLTLQMKLRKENGGGSSTIIIVVVLLVVIVGAYLLLRKRK